MPTIPKGILRFQSTPPARGATLSRENCYPHTSISIHAPREGGDSPQLPVPQSRTYFNPRPPRGGRRWAWFFLLSCIYDFNPRPPRGGRPRFQEYGQTRCNFNPRPPRGGRLKPTMALRSSSTFQSTPPARGATKPGKTVATCILISIHAPREGGDPNTDVYQGGQDGISIHAPREGGDSKDAQFYL